ncbi:MAG: C40 family peptidase [Betaproteobacteria bacterium]|nr:C40 family peptidase [Betaproteobacteria bacterium]
MANDLLAFIQQEGARQYPSEACGLVVRVGKKSVPVACKNVAENPQAHFVMDVVDYAKVSDMGEVVGVWHTHVEIPPTPSVADKRGCENSEMPWYIVSVSKAGDGFAFSDMEILEPSGFELDYLERPYAFGVLDCWSLVRDYYRREYGIRLGDYPRIERFWAKGHNFFGNPEHWKNEGFKQLIGGEEPQAGDLLFFQTSGDIPNHVAVYIYDDTILHHPHGRLSRRDIYGGYWQKHAIIHLRHEIKCT